MKKFFIPVATLALVFSSVVLVSCGDDDDKNDNPQPQNAAPTVNITNPKVGSGYVLSAGKVDSIMTIEATATDDGSISKVEFYIDGAKIGEDNSSPYSYDYNFAANNQYTIKVNATDNNGVVGTKEIIVAPLSTL